MPVLPKRLETGRYCCYDSQMVRYLSGKILQLIGKAAKGVFFAVHLISPSLRFDVPSVSKPIFSTKAGGTIPKIVWQTDFSSTVTLAIYANYLFNRLMAPTHEFRFVDDAGAAEFIRTTFPGETWGNYRRLQVGAAKADFWRLLVIYHHGGAYMDMDATLTWPLEKTLRNQTEVFLTHGKKFTNFFVASVHGTDHIVLLIDAINRNIAVDVEKSVNNLTGPTILVKAFAGLKVNAVSYSVACRQNVFTNRFFQYRDRPGEKWVEKQTVIPIIGEG